MLYTEGLECTTQAISSLDCDKSLLDLVIYLVLMWLLPVGVKGYSLMARALSKFKIVYRV